MKESRIYREPATYRFILKADREVDGEVKSCVIFVQDLHGSESSGLGRFKKLTKHMYVNADNRVIESHRVSIEDQLA